MTKYYYDSLPKAAYMRDAFGLEFSEKNNKFYVNGKDPIFKVKEGDIRIERIINPIIYVAEIKYPNILKYVALNHNSSYAIDTEKDRDRLAIHCRNGKPFFMPIMEVEND